MAENKSNASTIVLAISVVLFVVLIAIGKRGSSDGSSAPAYNCTDTDVMVWAEENVQRSLKNPKSAEFSWSDETKITRTGDHIELTGWVESTNSFNAVIRTPYWFKCDCINGELKNGTYGLVE